MSRLARVRLFLWDGDKDFQMECEQLMELEESLKAPLYPLLARLGAKAALLHEVRETLRIGLVGAGMDRQAAHDLVVKACTPGAYQALFATAYGVLGSGLEGVPREDPALGEPVAETPAMKKKTKASSSRTDGSAGASSTA